MQYILTLLSYNSSIWQNILDSLVTKVAINQHFIEATSPHIVDKYDQIPNTFWKEPTSVEFDLTNGSISEHFLGNANPRTDKLASLETNGKNKKKIQNNFNGNMEIDKVVTIVTILCGNLYNALNLSSPLFDLRMSGRACPRRNTIWFYFKYGWNDNFPETKRFILIFF